MRVQAGVQREVEQACTRFGIPTRTEIDAAHRRINQLERALRRAGVVAGNAAAPADGDDVQAAKRKPASRRKDAGTSRRSRP